MYTLSRKFPLFSHFIYRQGINGSYCFCHFNSVHCCRCNATGVTSALSAGVDSFYIGSEFFWFPHDPDRRRCTAFYSFQQCIRPVKTGKFFSKSMDSGFNGIPDLFRENAADIGKCIGSFDTGAHISKFDTFLMRTVIFEKLYRNFSVSGFPGSTFQLSLECDSSKNALLRKIRRIY